MKDTDLGENQSYAYAVFTRDTAGNTTSTPVTITSSTDITPPGPVTNLTVTSRAADALGLSWTNPADTDLAEVIVRRATGATAPTSAADGTAVSLGSPTTTSVTDSGLASDTTYSYAVFTRDTTGNTSTPVTVTFSTDITAPGPVTNLTMANRTATSLALSWTNPDDADLAEVIVRRTTGDTTPTSPTDGTAVTLDDPTATSVTDRQITNAGKYSYAVFARDTAGNTSNPAGAVSSRYEGTVVDAGVFHTCALLADGTARCWGDNGYGQIGDSTYTDRLTPVQVSGITTAIAISAGGNHTCALLADGTVHCWGDNSYGQIGDSTYTDRLTPVPVSGITTAIAISAGVFHTCALLADGTARCWGYNKYGQIGDGTTIDRRTAVPVSGITTATAISASSVHTCALLADGTARCWGDNSGGQIGDGTNTNRHTPVPVSGITTATAISAGGNHTCALLADGTAHCWGYNLYGQLGDGTTIDRLTAVQVSGIITTAIAISAGGNHRCALLADDTAHCWGNNSSGQIGDGTTTDRLTAVPVSGITTATAISASSVHTCALLADDTAHCWGDNSSGQIGDGTNTNQDTPVPVSGITTAN